MKVRDVLKLIQKDGWYLARTRGSHRQLKHNLKPGLVTVPASPATTSPLGRTIASSNKPV